MLRRQVSFTPTRRSTSQQWKPRCEKPFILVLIVLFSSSAVDVVLLTGTTRNSGVCASIWCFRIHDERDTGIVLSFTNTRGFTRVCAPAASRHRDTPNLPNHHSYLPVAHKQDSNASNLYPSHGFLTPSHPDYNSILQSITSFTSQPEI